MGVEELGFEGRVSRFKVCRGLRLDLHGLVRHILVERNKAEVRVILIQRVVYYGFGVRGIGVLGFGVWGLGFRGSRFMGSGLKLRV